MLNMIAGLAMIAILMAGLAMIAILIAIVGLCVDE